MLPSASPTSPFGPAAQSIALWISATVVSTLNSSTSLIGQLVDLSTNSYVFSQSTAGKQPRYSSTGMSGYPTISFGPSQWLMSAKSTILPLNSSYTLIALVQYNGGKWLLGHSSNGFSYGVPSNHFCDVMIINRYKIAANSSTYGLSWTVPTLLSVVYTLETNLVQYYINSTLVGTTTEVGIAQTYPLLLGCSWQMQCWGDVGTSNLSELMIFNTSLSATQRSYYESSVAQKYDVANLLLAQSSQYPSFTVAAPLGKQLSDTTAIQAVVNHAVDAGGATITIMPGVYNITYNIGLSHYTRALANTVIQGCTSNPSDTRLKVWVTMADLSIFSAGLAINNVTFRNLWFDLGGDGVSPTTTAPPVYKSGHGAEGIVISAGSNLLINNCVFDHAFLGRDISVYNGVNVTVNNCSITNHVGMDPSLGLPPDWEAIALYNSYNTTITNNLFNNYSTYVAGFIEVFTVSNLTTISNNQFLNKQRGNDISIIGWDYHIVNNTANSISNGGCFLYVNGIVNSTIENNVITGGCSAGNCQMGFCSMGNEQSVSVRNNTFVNVSYPVRIPNPSRHVTNFSFVGNTVINPIYYGVTIGYNPVSSTIQTIVANNTFLNLTSLSSKSAAVNVIGNPGFNTNITTTAVISAGLTAAIKVSVAVSGYGILYPLANQLIDLDTGSSKETLLVQAISFSAGSTSGSLTLLPLLAHKAGVPVVYSTSNLPNAGFSGVAVTGNKFIGNASAAPLVSISSVRDVNYTLNYVDGSLLPAESSFYGGGTPYTGSGTPASYYVAAALSGTNQSYLDSKGNHWTSDLAWFIGGAGGVAPAYTTTVAITKTADPFLFSTLRTWGEVWGQTARQYMFPLQNGQYNVTMLFVETQNHYAGARVMNISIGNTLVYPFYDVWQAANGRYMATTLSSLQTVTTGVLYITFTAVVGWPVICAISLKLAP